VSSSIGEQREGIQGINRLSNVRKDKKICRYHDIPIRLTIYFIVI